MNSELEKNYMSLKRLHDSANKAILQLQAIVEKLTAENDFYKSQLINADQNIVIQKKIVIDNIRQSQVIQENLQNEIIELRRRLKQKD